MLLRAWAHFAAQFGADSEIGMRAEDRGPTDTRRKIGTRWIDDAFVPGKENCEDQARGCIPVKLNKVNRFMAEEFIGSSEWY